MPLSEPAVPGDVRPRTRSLSEVDVNPLIATADGVVAVDALVVSQGATREA